MKLASPSKQVEGISIDEESEDFAPPPPSFQLQLSAGSITLENMKDEAGKDSMPKMTRPRASIAKLEISDEDSNDLKNFLSNLEDSEELQLADHDNAATGVHGVDQMLQDPAKLNNAAPSRPDRRKSARKSLVSFVIPEEDAAEMARMMAEFDDDSDEEEEEDYEAIDSPSKPIQRKAPTKAPLKDSAPRRADRRASRKISLEFAITLSDDEGDHEEPAEPSSGSTKGKGEHPKLTLREASLRTLMNNLSVSKVPQRRRRPTD